MNFNAKLLVAAVAAEQQGRIRYEQILSVGVARIRIHLPSSRTRSRIEQLLLTLCQRYGIRLPDGINVYLFGWLVDAVWHASKLVVEIDETSGHKTPAQIRQDRQREFDLRAKGYIVLRHTEEQLMTMPEAVAAEIASYL